MTSEAPAAVPQHMQALKRANEIRHARVEALHKLSSGELPLCVALHHPALQSAQLLVVCAALPWRRNRKPGTSGARTYARNAEGMLRRAGIMQHKVVGTMTARQRRVLNAEWRATRPLR